MNTGNGLLKAAGLWSKTSARGNPYMVGRLGGVKVYVFENRDRQSDSDPTHVLCFGDGQPAGTAPAAAPRQAAQPTRRSPASRQSPAACPTGDPGRPFNDDIPDFLK